MLRRSRETGVNTRPCSCSLAGIVPKSGQYSAVTGFTREYRLGLGYGLNQLMVGR